MEVAKRLKVNGSGGGHASLHAALAQADNDAMQSTTSCSPISTSTTPGTLISSPAPASSFSGKRFFTPSNRSPRSEFYYQKETLIDLLQRKRPRALRLIEGDLELVEVAFAF